MNSEDDSLSLHDDTVYDNVYDTDDTDDNLYDVYYDVHEEMDVDSPGARWTLA